MQESDQEQTSHSENGWDWISVLQSEFRSPISFIDGSAHLLLTEMEEIGPLTEEQRKWILRISQNNNRMRLILRGVADIARIHGYLQIYTSEKLNIKFCIEEALKKITPLITAKNQILTNHLPDLPLLYADKFLLIIIIERLLENASKYTPDDGKITITTEKENNFVKTKIIDTGFGIDFEDQRLIFEIWYRSINPNIRKEEGAGVSLYFCKKCIEYFGGQIGFESEPGKGSTFWFTLPIATDENDPDQPSSRPPD